MEYGAISTEEYIRNYKKQSSLISKSFDIDAVSASLLHNYSACVHVQWTAVQWTFPCANLLVWMIYSQIYVQRVYVVYTFYPCFSVIGCYTQECSIKNIHKSTCNLSWSNWTVPKLGYIVWAARWGRMPAASSTCFTSWIWWMLQLSMINTDYLLRNGCISEIPLPLMKS